MRVGSEPHGPRAQTNDVCPGPEELAAFLDGRLTEADRRQIVSHAADCARCRELLGEAAAALDATEPGSFEVRGAHPPFWRSPLGFALATAALAVLSIVPWLIVSRNANTGAPATLRADLMRQLGERRSFESRVIAQPDPGPLQSVPRSAGDEPGLPPQLEYLVARIENLRRAEPSPETEAVAGVARLAAGEVDAAIAALSAALAGQPARADWQNDLAAALIWRGLSTKRRSDLDEGVRLAREVVDRDGRLLEARFNVALGITGLFAMGAEPKAAAIAAWDDYIRLDADSGWARLARDRREQLAQR